MSIEKTRTDHDPVTHPRPEAPRYSRTAHPADTVVAVGDARIGAGRPVVIAGPCAVESRDQLLEAARLAREAGADLLRGGAFKPRTSPYSFQGLGEDGLALLAEARAETGLPVVTEVMAPEDVPRVAAFADMLQIGSRNMQNFPLLRAVGRTRTPVLLKRGMSATLEEFLSSAEYILAEGNGAVVLCERGIRTFSDFSRNTLDLNVVPAIQAVSHLPVVVDPSHGTGRSDLVPAMALAALAAGAAGVMIEIHPHPDAALSDGDQAVDPGAFRRLMARLTRFQQWLESDGDADDAPAHP